MKYILVVDGEHLKISLTQNSTKWVTCITKSKYSQTCVQRPPLAPEKSGRLTEVSDKTEIQTGR